MSQPSCHLINLQQSKFQAKGSQENHGHQIADKQANSHQNILLRKKTKRENYRWSPSQHRRYVNFLAENVDLFKLPYEQKIKLKIQVMMSNVVLNRTSYQCRSHHQKMLTRYGSIQNIIQHFRDLLIPSTPIKAEQPQQKEMPDYNPQNESFIQDQCKVQESCSIKLLPCSSRLMTRQTQEILKQQDEQVFYKTYA